VFFPSPGNKHVDVQEVFHGKSARISRTVSVVRGGVPAGEEKILAPVCEQRVWRNLPDFPPPFNARRRINSETVIFFTRASARILRASSVETLKVIVGIVLRYYHVRYLQVYFSK